MTLIKDCGALVENCFDESPATGEQGFLAAFASSDLYDSRPCRSPRSLAALVKDRGQRVRRSHLSTPGRDASCFDPFLCQRYIVDDLLHAQRKRRARSPSACSGPLSTAQSFQSHKSSSRLVGHSELRPVHGLEAPNLAKARGVSPPSPSEY